MNHQIISHRLCFFWNRVALVVVSISKQYNTTRHRSCRFSLLFPSYYRTGDAHFARDSPLLGPALPSTAATADSTESLPEFLRPISLLDLIRDSVGRVHPTLTYSLSLSNIEQDSGFGDTINRRLLISGRDFTRSQTTRRRTNELLRKMRSSRSSPKRSLLLATVFTLALFTAGTLAQTSDDDTTTAAAATTATGTTATATTTSDSETSTSTSSTEATTTSASTSDDTTTSATSSMPSLSTSSTSANSDMPTLSSTTNAADTSIPTYPAPTVPPTQDAPYMQTSNMPDGTFFIAVGAILGAFGLGILLWRAIIACLLHRSVEKAAMTQHLAQDKTIFPTPPAPFYKYSDHDSAQNMGSVGRGVRRSTRGPIPSATPSATNLFFSPTAAPGANPRDSVYRDTPNRDSTYRDSSYRDSRFLPAGFYAAGQSSPANLDGADGSSISLTNLNPDSRGHARGLSGHAAPDSPGFGPQRSPMGRPGEISSSSVNLNVAPDGRAPSAYLDDLLADQPELFPPAGTMPTSTNPNHPYRQSGRF